MASCWWGVLLLSAVTLHLGLSQPPVPNTWEEGEIQEAVRLYNQREDGGFLFRYLTDLPTTLLEEEGASPAATFLIKETGCLKSEDTPPESCDYRQDGEVKICGFYPNTEERPGTLHCDSLSLGESSMRSSDRRRCSGRLCFVLQTKPKPGSFSGILRPGKE